MSETPPAFRQFEQYQDQAAFERLKAALDIEMHGWYQDFPSLRNPVPPAPISDPQYGTKSIRSSEIWRESVRRWRSGEYRLPVSDSTERLAGPVVTIGGCLEPIIDDSIRCWYDARQPAKSGDFVLVRMDPAALQSLIERCSSDPQWLAKYADLFSKPGPVTKLLFAFGPYYFLVENRTLQPLGQNRILGVLRHTER